MKLFVTGRYVDLDFGSVTPVKLGQKFASEEVALSAAIMIAQGLREMITEFTFYSEKYQKTIVGLEAMSLLKSGSRKPTKKARVKSKESVSRRKTS